ncbi:MAG: hypothetical protein L0177_14245 [Chloroflexi bacterium]|nr:hypothetical protein [Chloroflexota bacterium]
MMGRAIHSEASRERGVTLPGGRSLHEDICKELELDAESRTCARKRFPLWLRILVPGVDRRLPADPW